MAGPKRKRDTDEDADNMFDSSAAAATALNSARASTRSLAKMNTGLRQQASQAGQSLGDASWDDDDGYYKATVHEMMGDRYVVTESACGKGVFSSVVKAKDVDLSAEGTGMVAIKIVRHNEAFRRAAVKEVEVLKALQSFDSTGRRHIVQMFSTFSYRNHLCIVFECLWDDCREALRKLTSGKGMTLSFVRMYTQQLLLGLRHMEKCNIFHADIKPDNILISEDQQIVKLCDLGTATDAAEAEISAYVMSRSYRAPEVILGYNPTCAADTFSLGCTCFELFTGKTLAAGRSNHDQLRKIMELKGNVPPSMIKGGAYGRKHFDENLAFKPDIIADRRHTSAEDAENGLALKIQQLKSQLEVFPQRSLKDLVFARVGTERCKSSKAEDQKYVLRATLFAALLEELLILDPHQRLKPKEALSHAFLS